MATSHAASTYVIADEGLLAVLMMILTTVLTEKSLPPRRRTHLQHSRHQTLQALAYQACSMGLT